ncbi:MAG: HAMP domain-containing histidine kinase [Sphingobacteriales bacterium]|nr:HAMP domain-containing histidine kinase [Sphingobacteriales bacterium]
MELQLQEVLIYFCHERQEMNKLRFIRILMALTILGVAGFQIYWLKQSYDREKKSLAIKADDAFKKTIMQLQVKKLKLDGVQWSSDDNGEFRVFVSTGKDSGKLKPPPKGEVISTINLISNKLRDSAGQMSKGKMIISVKESSVSMHGDSTKLVRQLHSAVPGGHIFDVLYGVDSLQEPLRTGEIDTAYKAMLQNKGINMPYSIIKIDTCGDFPEEKPNEVTVGFAKPVVYRMQPGNTFPHLLKKISLPILFSVILLGITILSFVLLYRNLVKQKRLAELKNEFISNITHELKTPIATVGVAIEALRNFNAINDPQRTKEYLDISQNELHRLSLLVDKVLKLSMFENRQLDLKFEQVNLKEIVDEVAASMKLQLEKHNATVNISCEGDVSLQGDRLHLTSVVFNLLDNAIKYSKTGPVIRVSVKGNKNNVELSVSDNGIGIAPEYKDKIFEKFFRIPHGNTHNAKGYGLGLSYVAQVIQKHNGTIEVESQPGPGTRFIIILPKQQA